MTEPEPQRRSLSEVHASVDVPTTKSAWRRLLAIAGPAYLVSVGYMDPGNWATDLAAGAQFNYTLIWVLLMSNIMAILLQSLASRLGVVAGVDLAQACRLEYGRFTNFSLYALCELAITACDLAEVLGSAIALQLLFGLPLIYGVVLTATDTFVILFLTHLGIRKLEAMIVGLIAVIGGCMLLEIGLAKPDWLAVAGGFVPHLPGGAALYIAIGMLGATVMPHNLYLHSSLVQTRNSGKSVENKRAAIRLNTVDSAIALNLAFFVNAAILIMAAAVFYRSGHFEVAEIQDAHRLLEPLLGHAAPIAFAVALLAAGQSSTITGTLAGQIAMEGFLHIRIPPWVRRLITRVLAITPAVLTIVYFGESGTGALLVLSQVVLSLQLPFAIVPLIHFVSSRERMGELAIGPRTKLASWAIALVIVALNVALVVETLTQWGQSSSTWVLALVSAVVLAITALLVHITILPLRQRRQQLRAAREPGIHGVPSPLDLGAEAAVEVVAIALDFSRFDANVLRQTARFLGAERPKLVLMHVTESVAARVLGADAADIETRKDSERLDAYAEQLREHGWEVDTLLGRGRRVGELVRMVDECDADLVVLGAHGHRLLADLVFGSTADALRHRVQAAVLIVTPGNKPR